MKKVLALVLVAVLALGMSVSGFAVDIKGFQGGWTLAGNGGDHSNIGYEGLRQEPNWYSTNSQVMGLGNVYAMDEPVVYINLQARMFEGITDTVSTSNTEKYVYVDASDFTKGGYVFQKTMSNRPQDWAAANRMIDVAYTSDANIGTATQLMPAVYSSYNATTEYSKYKMPTLIGSNVTDFDTWLQAYKDLGMVKYTTNASLTTALYFVDSYDVKVKEVDKTASGLDDARNLTSDEIRTNKIKMSTTTKSTSNAVKDIELRSNKGDIRFRAVDEWVSTGNKDFEVVIYISIDGKRYDDKHITITGNMRNPEIFVDGDADNVDIDKGYVAVANDFNPKIAVYVGNGATIHTKFFKDKKYYGITKRDNDEEADVVFRQYKDVDNVLTFKVVGLNSTYDYVTLSTDYSAYYVYDENMNYLGRGDEQLTFSKKYYLANRQLDIDSDLEEEDDWTAPEVSDPNLGGDGAATGNVNANPGTGR